MEATKRCSTCKQFFPANGDGFYRNPKQRDGLSNQCKKCHSKVSVAWAAKNRERKNANVRAWHVRVRQEVLAHYSGGTPHCACCGEDHLEFLVLDHVNGDGASHRREVGAGKNRGVYMWARQNGFPDGLQTLCQNCNSAKAFYGECPHERERRNAG